MGIITHVVCPARRRNDAGLTLVEVLVALTLLMGLSLTVAAGLLAVQHSAMTSKERSAAANLATREVEVVRNWFHSGDTAPIAVMTAGDTVNGSPLPGQTGPLVVDNVPYTVKRQVAWLVTGTGASACDGGGVVAYPSVSLHVEVTWPNMGAVPPVVSDTVLTPPKNVINATSGYLAVKVTDRDGLPNDDRVITATGPGGTFSDKTGPDGCATFVLTTPGLYTTAVTEASSGFVSFNGATTQSATVATGSLVVRSFTYDQGVLYRATLTPPPGYPLPVTLPAITLGNSGILPAGVASYASVAGGVTTVGPVWPFLSGDSVWAGSCPDSDPAFDTTRPAAIVSSRGSTTSTTAVLQGITVTTTRLGIPVNVPVTATYAGPGTCTLGDSVLNLGTSSGAGLLKSSLPFGAWNLSATMGGVPVTGSIDMTPAGPIAVTLNGTS